LIGRPRPPAPAGAPTAAANVNAPGGFERMFELAPQSVEDAMTGFDRYGIQAVGPHPRDAA